MPPPLAFLLRFPSRLRRRARRSRMLTLFLLFSLIFVVIYPFYAIYKPPALLIRYFQHRWPDVLWEVDVAPRGRKILALTIDDAPSEFTQDILAALRENGARATFFVLGNQAKERPELLNAIVAGGHDLANHAMRDEPARALPTDVLKDQILQVQTQLDEAYSLVGRPRPRTKFYRPGSGFFNDAMRVMVREMGFVLALGSVYPHDPQVPYAWVNARHVLSMVRPGAVVICHDRRGWTAPMLRTVLPKLKRKGWEVVTLSDLVEAAKVE